MFAQKTVIVLTCAMMLGLFSGCGTIHEATVPDPPKLTSFLPRHELLVRQRAEFPLHYFWRDKNANWDDYTAIYIAPVNLSYIMKDNWWNQVSAASMVKIKKELPAVGEYMRNAFIKELRKVESKGGFKVVDNPGGAGTVTLELAITQLVPTEAELNYLGTAGDFFLPGSGLAASMVSAGCVSFEGKLIDPAKGRLLLMVADRENDPAGLISLTSYTWYGSAEYNMDKWARQAAAMSVANRLEDVSREFPLHLIVY